MDIIITADGNLRFIYNDDAAELLSEGTAQINRASHVEPGAGGWMVDMSPVNGPKFGPFTLRADALAAEVNWLQEHRGL
jgi:hypothetical protein